MLLGAKMVLKNLTTPEKHHRMVGASLPRGPHWGTVCERTMEKAVFSGVQSRRTGCILRKRPNATTSQAYKGP